MTKNKQFFIVGAVIVILAIVAFTLYNKFFNKVVFDTEFIPEAEIFRIAPPSDIPEFAVADHQGKLVNITNFKGKIILVNFWAMWCQPCVKELPQLDSLIDIFGAENIAVIAISIDKNATIDDLNKFFAKLEIKNITPYHDPELQAFNITNSTAIPATILIDRNLQAHLKISGYLDWHDQEIMNIINQLP